MHGGDLATQLPHGLKALLISWIHLWEMETMTGKKGALVGFLTAHGNVDVMK